ncbi:MAG: hypothetical protein AB7N24_19800 [Dehalococcoidia bacterium]
MTNSTPSVLRDTAFLSALLDTLIPPGGNRRMPGAGAIGIESALADAVTSDAQAGSAIAAWLNALSEHNPEFSRLLPAERATRLEAHAAAEPAPLRALLRHIYLAYYQHPTVLTALGEPPRPPFPEGFEIEPTDPGLLAALTARRDPGNRR